MMERLKDGWNSLSLFNKVFLVTVSFAGAFAVLGEWAENWGAALVLGSEDELSDVQEVLLWAFCTLVVTAVQCLLLTRILLNIINRFVSAIRHLSEGALGTRIDREIAGRGDEFGFMARAFNDMARSLEENQCRERALLAAVSHELRSPLTRLSVVAELLRREQVSSRSIEHLELETERMNALIGSILEYSRCEMSTPSFAPLDMPALIRDVADDVRFEGSVRGCGVSLNIPDSLTMRGNRVQLRHALENVMRNALNYSPECGDIAVTGKKKGDFFEIVVADRGPGVPEEALHQLFRPFFRVETSRERSRGGSGMGLAIAESIVRGHHGRIWAENRQGGGLAVTLELPFDPASCPKAPEDIRTNAG
ncbi:ATP-binding protein [uncultured Mailhella sp.]|uniref:sensor histidine kinase n=1 Tax=uncultured Mailhella sp. TaxID=1981031 RepID=UPI0026276EDE|nr:ATP-binding protein [uncultured Mailhella sp.]